MGRRRARGETPKAQHQKSPPAIESTMGVERGVKRRRSGSWSSGAASARVPPGRWPRAAQAADPLTAGELEPSRARPMAPPVGVTMTCIGSGSAGGAAVAGRDGLTLGRPSMFATALLEPLGRLRDACDVRAVGLDRDLRNVRDGWTLPGWSAVRRGNAPFVGSATAAGRETPIGSNDIGLVTTDGDEGTRFRFSPAPGTACVAGGLKPTRVRAHAAAGAERRAPAKEPATEARARESALAKASGWGRAKASASGPAKASTSGPARASTSGPAKASGWGRARAPGGARCG